jgi:hypothetical protein
MAVRTVFAATLLAAAVAAAGPAVAQRFEFGVIGDIPYSAAEEAQIPALLADMDRRDLAFVVNVGDLQADPRNYRDGAPPCTDETLRVRHAMLDASRHPMVVTPGDNDWSDCAFVRGTAINPLERLARMREVFFSARESLGQRRMRLERQSDGPGGPAYPENARWTQGGVVFATMHVVGSNNNWGRVPAMDAEHAARDAANIAWMGEAFVTAHAADAPAVVLLIQANPGFEGAWALRRRAIFVSTAGVEGPPDERGPTGFDAFRAALEREVTAFARPVLLVHGDTHIFRVDKPLVDARDRRMVTNLTRLEGFGSPDVHWVRVTVDPTDPDVFAIRPQIVPENANPPRR